MRGHSGRETSLPECPFRSLTAAERTSSELKLPKFLVHRFPSLLLQNTHRIAVKRVGSAFRYPPSIASEPSFQTAVILNPVVERFGRMPFLWRG